MHMDPNRNDSIASSEYARRRKEVFELTKDLRASGVAADIGVPCIAVIGAQSAGKSSLVEAVTGINVPRDSGTCTRCPMECAISVSATTWACQVSIRRETLSTRPTTLFGPKLTNKGEVEIQIRRAQASVLSPHKSHEDFLSSTYDELREMSAQDPEILKFSKDVVVVDIEDPDGTDLAFVDLPGLIQNEHEEAINLVKGLVEEYINRPSTIILVTIPASDDMENQLAARLARQADPDGERTIGVLTKPDSLTSGATSKRKLWQDVLQGRAHQLQHGYYAVRLPDDEDRKNNVSREEMERIATKFFSSHKPWMEVMASNRLGVRNMVSDISKLLMKVIENSLPYQKQEVQRLLDECQDELNKLPEPITVNPVTEILDRISYFCKELQDIVYGRGEDKTFVHRNRGVYRSFKIDIRNTAPDFRPFESPKDYIMPFTPHSLTESDEESFPSEAIGMGITPDMMGLYDVRKVIKDATGWELPRNIPYDAKAHLYKKFLDKWPSPSEECYNKICSILAEFVNHFISKHFGRFKALESHIGALIRNEMSRVSQESHRATMKILESESYPFFTQNTHYLESTYTSWLAHYKLVRSNTEGYRGPEREYLANVPRTYETPEQRALKALGELGYSDLRIQDLARLHPPDKFQAELEVMADVRAYFQVAYKRVIDNIPMTIQHALNQTLADNMQKYLIDKMEFGGADDSSHRFKDLVAEDPDIAINRARLEARKEQLQNTKEKLDAFTIY